MLAVCPPLHLHLQFPNMQEVIAPSGSVDLNLGGQCPVVFSPNQQFCAVFYSVVIFPLSVQSKLLCDRLCATAVQHSGPKPAPHDLGSHAGVQ